MACGGRSSHFPLGMEFMAEMHQALVFDYDGVIADTEPLHWRSWAALLSPFGFDLSWEEYCGLGRGVSDGQIYQLLRQRARLPDASEFFRLNLERKRKVREWSLQELPISQATVAMLRSLGNHRLGLVTSSAQFDAEPILRTAAIYDLFQSIVFGEDVASTKPSPDPYLLIAQRLGIETGIAFEDSEPGLESALAAGFTAVKIERPEDLPRIVAQSVGREG